MGISTLYERNLFSEISVSEKTIKYKNIYFYVNFKNNKTLALKYSLRFFYFIKLCDFFKILNYNLIILLRLFNRYYKHTLWAIFLQNYNLQIFYLIVKKLIHLYNSYNFSTENFTTHNTELSSINFLFFNDFKNTSFFMNYNKIYSNLNLMLIQNIKGDNFKDCEKLDKAFSIFFYNFNYGEIYYTIHFLRVQRRYNKRRYSRVRAVSRPSFFAGISLSSILIAGF